MATFQIPSSLVRQRIQLRCCTTAKAPQRAIPRLLIAHPYSTAVPEIPRLPPKVERATTKLFKNADEAVSDLKSGSIILSSGFGLCGVPGKFA